MGALFARFPLALQAVYSDLKQRAFEQQSLLVGTPGTVSERVQDGRTYLYRQFYDSEGTKGAEHIGPSDDEAALATADAMRARIAAANELLTPSKLLARSGYVRTDARTDAVLVAMANAGLFRAGAILIGTNALGALLNDLGARVAAVVTEDVDIARRERLELPQGEALSFTAILEQSRVPIRPVPSLDRKGYSTSFATLPRFVRGKGVRVDLLAPTPNAEPTVVRVPELGAHAMGLPYLRYLLTAPLDSIVIGRSSVIPVKVPRPERILWHKMLVSQLRAATSGKAQKDLEQAAILFALLTEDDPEAIGEAHRALPTSARSKITRAATLVEKRLATAGHDDAVALLCELL